MNVDAPIWLLLVLPVGVLLWLAPMPTRLLRWLRAGVVGCVVLALAGVMVRLPGRGGTVVVVADRSASMPATAGASEREVVALVERPMKGDDRLGVVSFADGVSVEKAPDGNRFGDFSGSAPPDASDLAGGIERALALIPSDRPGRVLVISDGRWTGRDPREVAASAAARGIAIDYRLMDRRGTGDLAIASVDAPQSVARGEGFLITAWVRSPVGQEVTYTLRRDGAVIASGRRRVPAGLSRLVFRDAVPGATVARYTVGVHASAPDPVPENNEAKALVGVRGLKPVLVVSDREESGLAGLLRRGGLDVRAIRPVDADWSLASLSGYSAVVLEEVPAEELGTSGMQSMAAWVEHTGSGLMMSGGPRGYGPGGYFRSPLDPVLPVSMELREEQRKMSVAIVVAMDRSGSMAMPAGGGRAKMDLADAGAAQVLEMLTPMDEFGVLAVDTAAHVIAPLGPVHDKAGVRDRILRVRSEGGGIFIYEALAGAVSMLKDAKANTRHIVLFADASDSEEPGRYVALLEECRKAGITCSVVGMGTDHGSDAGLLKDVARRGGGRVYFSDRPEDLPRLFAQDTFVVARSSFVEQATGVKITPVMATLTGRGYAADPPAVGGYSLTYLREGAQASATSRDGYRAPLVASWSAGTGRVLCYTPELEGKFAGAIAGWPGLGEMVTGLVRWTAGAQGELGPQMMLTQRVRDGVCTVELHLDGSRGVGQMSAVPEAVVLRAAAGREPVAQRRAMEWTSPDTLAVEVPLRGEETAVTTVRVAGHGAVTLPPVTLAYSPEFKPDVTGRGEATLAELARITGGRSRLELTGVWEGLPRRARAVSMQSWFLITAVVLMLIEVMERRTGMVSMTMERVMHGARARRRATAERATATTSRGVEVDSVADVLAKPATPSSKVTGAMSPPTASPTVPPAASPSPRESSDGVLDAMDLARRRTQQRTHRNNQA